MKTKRFRNHLSFARSWLDDPGSEDCHGRALWALGLGVGRSPYRSFQALAGELFAQALPAVTDFTSPRAWAFALIGIHEYLRRLSGDRLVQQTRETLIARLMALFEQTQVEKGKFSKRGSRAMLSEISHAQVSRSRLFLQNCTPPATRSEASRDSPHVCRVHDALTVSVQAAMASVFLAEQFKEPQVRNC